ncbi:MAG TPA: hypothetical protein ENN21_02860, partial [Spirochaetes bacterium]|nr:hypothetical protein [Spirochaetota bacterium]
MVRCLWCRNTRVCLFYQSSHTTSQIMEVSMAQFNETTMAQVFFRNAEKYTDRPYASYKKDGVWLDITWKSMDTMVRKLAYYLMSIGIEKGDKVGLFSPNRWEWHLSALAINSIGAVDVPIYATNSSEESEYILNNSDSKICLVGTVDHLNTILRVRSKLPNIKQIIVFDETAGQDSFVITLSKALAEGEKSPNAELMKKRLTEIKPSDLSTIIYTSGTTGNPKGVMLTHNNFVSNVINVFKEMIDRKTGNDLLTTEDTFLSFLPLSHSLERTAGFYGALA